MRKRRTSIAASPLLVGSVTVLVTIVAVFLAYNANAGLPFVPTYEVRAELPNGAKLIPGNAVRIGGDRVGQVTALEPRTVVRDGEPVTVAVAELELDKRVEPLPADTRVTVRPQSLLGLKYVELVPGRSKRPLAHGATIPLERAQAPVELEEVLSTFDAETRVAARAALEGYGDGLAGRGEAINRTLRDLNPLLRHLEPVMTALSDPGTGLARLVRALGAAAGQAAPVARVQAALFADAADTFAALARDERALEEAIARSPGTIDAAVSSLRVQRPLLASFAALSRELEPASAELARTVGPLQSALAAGAPALEGAPRTNELGRRALAQLDALAENPQTLVGLGQLHRTVDVTAPLVRFVAPVQLVCNYMNYYLGPLGTHQSEEVQGGTLERVRVTLGNLLQDNNLQSSTADRPADIPAGQDPQEARNLLGPLNRLATQFYGPSVTPDGKADCQAGQTGYMDGPLNTGGRYGPDEDGGRAVLLDPYTPGPRHGGTWVSRRLGIDSLEDVK
mgnify:FL=1